MSCWCRCLCLCVEFSIMGWEVDGTAYGGGGFAFPACSKYWPRVSGGETNGKVLFLELVLS